MKIPQFPTRHAGELLSRERGAYTAIHHTVRPALSGPRDQGQAPTGLMEVVATGVVGPSGYLSELRQVQWAMG